MKARHTHHGLPKPKMQHAAKRVNVQVKVVWQNICNRNSNPQENMLLLIFDPQLQELAKLANLNLNKATSDEFLTSLLELSNISFSYDNVHKNITDTKLQ